jgi:hypothetical protein
MVYRLFAPSSAMLYLDVTTEPEVQALAALKDDNDKPTPKKNRKLPDNLYLPFIWPLFALWVVRSLKR